MSTLSPLLLLTGATAQGKTSFLLDLCQSASSPVWMLLPHPLAHEVVSLNLARRAIAPDQVSLFTPGQLVRTLAKRLPSSPTGIDIATQYMLVRQTVAHLAAANALGPFAAIAETGGFIRTLTAFLEEWTHMAHPIPPDVSHERARVLLAAYTTYQTLLRERGIADIHTLLRHLLNAIEAGHFTPGVPTLLVDGFADLTPLQCRFLAALARYGTAVMVALTDNHPHSVDAPFQRTRERLRATCEQMGVPIETQTVPPAPCEHAPLLASIGSTLFEPETPLLNENQEQGANNVHFIEAADIEGEVRAVLRHVRRWLDAGTPAHEIQIVAANLDEIAPLLMGVSQEYGIPLALAREEPLLANPLINHIATLLEIERREFRREDLLDIWHSPFFQWEWPDDETIHALERLSAEEIVVRGRQTWLEALQRLPEEAASQLEGFEDAEETDETATTRLRLHLSLTNPAQLDRWREQLDAFFTQLSPPSRASFSEYVEWLQNLLDKAHITTALAEDTSPHTERHRAAWDTFQAQLAALKEGALLAGFETLDWRTFAGIVRAMLNGVRYFYRSSALDEAVLATDPTLARGVQRPRICLLRLNESVWPAPTPPDPLLRPHERCALNAAGIPLRLPDPSVEMATFYEIVAHARYLLLSRTRFDESGTPWPPSPFWIAVASLLPGAPIEKVRRGAPPTPQTALSPAEQVLAAVVSAPSGENAPHLPPDDERRDRIMRVKRLADIERRRLDGQGGIYDGSLPDEDPFRTLLLHLVESQAWSATAFRDYALSPVRYFARRVLHLREPEMLREGIHRRHYGQLVHAILEKVFAGLHAPLTPDTLDEALARLEQVASETFERAPEVFGFRADALWEWEQHSIRRMLRRHLRWEASTDKLPHADPYQQERSITFSFQVDDSDGNPIEIRITGIVDRIDRDSAGMLHLFDYKTGTKKISKEEIVRGWYVQLPVYWWGVQEQLNAPIASACFVHVRNQTVSGVLNAETFAEHEADIRAAMADIVRKVRNGIFPAEPAQPQKNGRCATFCAFVDFCRCSHERRQSTQEPASQ